MEYQGFRSISKYERECARLSYKTRRVPFHDNTGGKFFALVTSCPGHPTGTSVEVWTLFTADETAFVLDGIISGGMMDPAKYMHDGLDVNYLGKLSAHGYYPDNPEEAANLAPAPAPALEIVEDGTDFPQFSLLPI